MEYPPGMNRNYILNSKNHIEKARELRDILTNKEHPRYNQKSLDSIYMDIKRHKQGIIEWLPLTKSPLKDELEAVLRDWDEIETWIEGYASNDLLKGGKKRKFKIKNRNKRTNKRKSMTKRRYKSKKRKTMRLKQRQKGGNYEQFVELCKKGDLTGAQEYLRLNPEVNIFQNIWGVFNNACAKGHLELAQWLLQVSGERGQDIPISDTNFFWACAGGHLEVAQWLLQLNPNINISCMNEYPFRIACDKGYLELAQWLYQVSKERGQDINVSTQDNEAFYFACLNRHLEVAQWLASLKPEYEIVNEDSPDWTCNVLTDPEEIKKKKNWMRRKTGVFLSNLNDKKNRNILSAMPTDVAKIANRYLG
jgi:hypothetical protein